MLDTLPSPNAQVVRLALDRPGQPPQHVIAKCALGEARVEAFRELQFYARLAPAWPHPAPALLGAWAHDDALVIVFEDLALAGYALAISPSPAQLRTAADVLVALHARFWNRLPVSLTDEPILPLVTQLARAWPPAHIATHAASLHAAAASLRPQLAPAHHALLDEACTRWAAQLLARASSGRALTVIHGDYHLFGNLFFATDTHLFASDPQLRVIDWSEHKPGLGPHDLSYCLSGVDAPDRLARDRALLEHYWRGLCAAGIRDYSWELCSWDFQFSRVLHLLQAVLQQSTHWFARHAAIIADADSLRSLRETPPV